MSQETLTSPTTTGQLLTSSPDAIELGLPGTDYRLMLTLEKPTEYQPGDRITGTIKARAKRVDVTGTGGRFVEPVFGRPRRLQGRIIGGDVEANEIFVSCGPTIVCTLTDPRQSAGDFAIGQIVGFDVEAGASIELSR